MFSFPAEINQELLQKFSRNEALRAGEYVELYIYFKSAAEHLKPLGPRFGLAQEAVAVDLNKLTEIVKSRSLLLYCNEVYNTMVKPSDISVSTGVGFLVVDFGDAKDVNEVSLSRELIVKKLKSLSYVKDVNWTEIGGTHGIYVDYNKASVPEDQAFSTVVGAIDGVTAVHKVV